MPRGSLPFNNQAIWPRDMYTDRYTYNVAGSSNPYTPAVYVGNNHTPSFQLGQAGLAPTAATNLLVIESGASKVTRVKRMIIYPGTATAAGIATLTLQRNTVAATAAGSTATAALLQRDVADAAFSGIVRYGAFTVVGVTTAATGLAFPIPTPASSVTTPASNIEIDFTNKGTLAGIIIPVGILNGLMFTHSGLSGAAGVSLYVDFTEE